MAFLFKGKKLPEGIDPARIPPGQTLTAPDRWPLLHFGPVPKTDIATWDFQVFGAVENPISLDYGELRALPPKDVVADIHCVTGWSRLGDTFTGVPIKEILDRVKPADRTAFVLRFIEGLELAEVATALDTSLATAKRRITRVWKRVSLLVERDPALAHYLNKELSS